MKKRKKKPEPQDFKTKQENEEALEAYYQSQPIYIAMNFILGNPKKIKNRQEGKPANPPY